MLVKKEVTYVAEEYKSPDNPVVGALVAGRPIAINPDGKTTHITIAGAPVTDGMFIVTGSDGSVRGYTKAELDAQFKEVEVVINQS